MTRAVTGLPQAVMTVQQARAAIEKGAKKDEIAMSGILTDPLSPLSGKQPGDKVTRDELIGFALEREAKVEDVVLGDLAKDIIKKHNYFGYDSATDAMHAYAKSPDKFSVSDSERAVLNATIEDGRFTTFREKRDRTHFSQYQLPGADEGSYREMFVTWPKNSAIESIRSKIEASVTNEDELHMQRTGEAPERLKPLYAALKEAQKREYGPEWNDGHSQYSDIANPIVRIRRNIRTDANGVKTYFIEEMQGPNKDGQAKMPPEIRKRIYEIGMKRALRDAVDEGADAIGWTTGEQQAERYSLENHVSSIHYGVADNRLWAYDKAGDEIEQLRGYYKPEKLPEVIGKEITEKLLNSPTSVQHAGGQFETKSLSGLDLKVGGE
ncbi:MAG: hypothetical protein EBS68_17910, partial [Rhodobacteraceae bacterium]|nr:hypothetical protein [Paracoccaceae bacterium]